MPIQKFDIKSMNLDSISSHETEMESCPQSIASFMKLIRSRHMKPNFMKLDFNAP